MEFPCTLFCLIKYGKRVKGWKWHGSIMHIALSSAHLREKGGEEG
jgi:hypothetical protein